jgi:hypothetical protein
MKKDTRRDTVLRLRVNEAEKKAWEAAALKEDRTLSAWIRCAANAFVVIDDAIGRGFVAGRDVRRVK